MLLRSDSVLSRDSLTHAFPESSCSLYDKDYETTASSSGDVTEKPVLTKRALCEEHMTTGICSLGGLCEYAHSLQEMLKEEQGFKAASCPNYHGKLSCSHGPDCTFIHSDCSRYEMGKRRRPANRYWLLHEYPDVLLGQAARNNSILFF